MSMQELYVLFEDATGYALFKTTEFEEIATFIPQVQDSILNASKFRYIVRLEAYQKFDSQIESLENAKCISDGILHKTLLLFLANSVRIFNKNKQKNMLGIQDPTLAANISETMGYGCSSSGAVMEIVRGIRTHFHKYIKAFHDVEVINKAKLSLCHRYSRDILKINSSKMDGMIRQSLDILNQLKQNTVILSSRVRKLYGVHFPELSKIITDPLQYLKCVKEIGLRTNLPNNIEELLIGIIENEDKVQNILKSAKNTMGMEINQEDMDNISDLIDQVFSLQKQENTQTEYVKSKMHTIAPSLGNLMGEMAGAYLIKQVGSLTRLSKLPASTIQVLGTKKSLFRSLKSKDAPIKFASISKSSFIGQDGRISKGKIARMLANKCCLAVRSDCFSETPSGIHGELLKQELQNHIRFYERRDKSLLNCEKKKRRRHKKNKPNKKRKTEVVDMEVER